ncbi:uncharacterized protein LY89DRAFT_617818, partial [Mollisia scopiformis]
MRGGQEEKKPQKMIIFRSANNSSGVNNGIHSVCKACSQSNRECTYPVAGTTPAPKRSEAPVGITIESDTGESKKRIRKIEDTGRRNSQKPGEDVLESPILTKKVWDELYEIFKLHYSTEMPFLHPPTFRNRMRQAAFPRDPATTPRDIEEGRVLLLGVLTLTARFHPGLIAHHSQNQDDPIAASEYYATALAAAFGPTIRNISNASLENIQALLMLGLYEWGQTRGMSSWLYVGLAIRLAFPMGLAFEDDPDKLLSQDSRSNRRIIRNDSAIPREDAIEKEVRRRTLWSCFIMDRMLSAGKERPTMINVDMLRVQLPCSDDQFLFVHNVKTGFLNSKWLDGTEVQHELTSVNDDGVLSRYIRLVDIFGRLSEWSYAGGRRTEKHPPWDPSTKFFQLRTQLDEFHDALPSSLTFTEANLSAHIEKRNATTYASMHTLYSLCLIVLHREYIPFIPLRCSAPSGPLDSPTFPPEKYDIPPGFWEESAEKIMLASRDIIQIVRTCQDNNALPESPQIGFAVWQAAFVCLYAAWFPQMDPSGHVVGRNPSHPPDKSAGYPGLTRRILSEMVPRLKMVKVYLKSIGKMHDYFHKVTHEYYNVYNKRNKLRGGGLEDYKSYEKELKEFGELKDASEVALSEGSDAADQVRSRASTNDIPGSSNGEPMQGIESATQRPNPSWAAVNGAVAPAAANASSPSVDDSKPYTTQYPYGPGPGYHPSPNLSSNAPSLISASNGDSTSSLNSPYVNNQMPYSVTQPQHAAAYPSVAQHTMGPP